MTAEPSGAERLIEEARGGSRKAFDVLATSLDERIESLVGSRLGPALRRKLDPEDVKQEVLLRAFEGLDGFSWRGEDSFLHWLGGIVQHVVLKAHERFRYRGTSPLDHDLAVEQASPSTLFRQEERFERLRHALEELEPDHRQVILLARIEKLPSREIAARMERSPAAIAQLLSRALKKLRGIFGDTDSLSLPDRTLGPSGGADGE